MSKLYHHCKVIDDIKLDFSDVLIRPKKSTLKSRSEVDLECQFFIKEHLWKGIPIFCSNMDTTGTFEMAHKLSEFNILTAIHKHYHLKDWRHFIEKNGKDFLKNISISMGIGDHERDRVARVVHEFPEIMMIMVDIANGYSENFLSELKKISEQFPKKILIAGNVVTPGMMVELFDVGVDIVKIGIGPGSCCTTRKITGVGYPQLSAILECAEVARKYGDKYIISDGGCTVPGDVSKAFGAGAHFVMLGGMFAGHKESGGVEMYDEETGKITHKEFYGMSSKKAMNKYHGGVANYRASEGKVVRIPYRGEIESTVLEILGGVRSTCSYVGARKLSKLHRNTTFIRVNKQLNTIFGNS